MSKRATLPKKVISLTDPRHLMRFLKAEAIGGTLRERAAAVAKDEGISVEAARRSIYQVDCYRRSHAQPEMDLAIRDLVISAIPLAKQSLMGLLMATELAEVPVPSTGKTKVITQVDKTTRLEANRLVKDLIVAVQPKGPAMEVNVSQTNQVANLSANVETNEERMRRLRKKAEEFNALPPEVAAVPDRIDSGAELDDEDDDEEDGEDDD